MDKLFQSILTLENIGECEQFFGDLCTIYELNSIAQRLEVASMLKNGCTYIDIAEKTGASTATISRVNRSLQYGLDGYGLVLERMAKTDSENGDKK